MMKKSHKRPVALSHSKNHLLQASPPLKARNPRERAQKMKRWKKKIL